MARKFLLGIEDRGDRSAVNTGEEVLAVLRLRHLLGDARQVSFPILLFNPCNKSIDIFLALDVHLGVVASGFGFGLFLVRRCRDRVCPRLACIFHAVSRFGVGGRGSGVGNVGEGVLCGRRCCDRCNGLWFEARLRCLPQHGTVTVAASTLASGSIAIDLSPGVALLPVMSSDLINISAWRGSAS